MMIEDQILQIKVWNHNDAVIFVYEQRYEKTDEKTESGNDQYKHWHEVVTAVPVNFGYGHELSDERKYELVKSVADSLADIYSYETDTYEMGVSFYINHRPYING